MTLGLGEARNYCHKRMWLTVTDPVNTPPAWPPGITRARGKNDLWQATEHVLDSIAIGAGILGTGGGGNPYIGQLRARQAIRQWGPVTVLAPEELPEDARVVCVGGIGAPTVGIEKVRDLQSYHALRAIEDYTGERATALISNEIGRQQLGRAVDSGGEGRSAGGGRRRHGPGLSRTADENLFRLWCAMLPDGRR